MPCVNCFSECPAITSWLSGRQFVEHSSVPEPDFGQCAIEALVFSLRIFLGPRERESRAWGAFVLLHDLLGEHVNHENEEAVRIDQRVLPRFTGVTKCHAIKSHPFGRQITCVRRGRKSWRTGAGFQSFWTHETVKAALGVPARLIT